MAGEEERGGGGGGEVADEPESPLDSNREVVSNADRSTAPRLYGGPVVTGPDHRSCI
eukprot:SAG31_NODE_132_length_23398_cov_14.557620_11_plen_57_part_00